MGPARHAYRGHAQAISLALRLLDILAVPLGAAVGYAIRFDFATRPLDAPYVALVLSGVVLAGIVFPWTGTYQTWRGSGLPAMFGRIVLGWIVVFLGVLFILFVGKWTDIYSRLWLGFWGISTLLGLVGIRVGLMALLRLLRRWGWNDRRVVIFGAGELGRSAYEATRQAEWSGFTVVAVLDDDPTKEGQSIGGIRVRRPDPDLWHAFSACEAEELWLALPLRAEDRVREIMHDLRYSTATIRMFPDVFGLRLLNYSAGEIAGMTVLNLSTTPITGINRVIKALEDRGLGAIALVLCSPALIAIALLIRVRMGSPVLFRQQRHGWDGRPITVYKFRTMKNEPNESDMPRQARRDDPRVTPLGQWLRRTSLDELPQLFNVLNGTMSLVGPRPHACAHNEYYKDEIEDYMKRHRVKPGITGWAQVHGFRGETETIEKMEKRVEFDLFYIENWSPLLDLQILFLTVVTVLEGRNAW